MKKSICLLVVMLLLCSCGSTNTELERGMMLRSQLLSARECTFDAEITADYGDKICSFSMNCIGNSDGSLLFTVTAPETIAGITGSVSEEGGKLTFDDTVLQFPLLADDQLSPVSAPWIFYHTLRNGYLTSAGMEDGQLRLSIDDSFRDDALHLDIWLNEADIPIRSEILHENTRILTLTVENFQIQ